MPEIQLSQTNETLLALSAGSQALTAAQPVGKTEPAQCKVVMTPAWNLHLTDEDLDEPIDVVIQVGVEWALKLTQHTLYSLASNFAIPKALLVETPPELTQPLVNYWLSVVGAEHAPQFVYDKNNVAVDLFRPYNAAQLNPSAMAIFVAEQLATASGAEPGDVEISSYMTATYREVVFRAFLPSPEEGAVTSTWRLGVQVSMSPSGVTSTLLTMVLRREDGLLVTIPRHEFKYSPKRHGATLDAYCEWISESIGIIVAEAPEERTRLQHLAEISVEADLQNILNDLYTTTTLPMSLKATINDAVEHLPPGATGYDLMVCVASAAYTPGEPEGRREKARRAAGRVYAVLGSRCTSCHSLLKEHAHDAREGSLR